MANTIEVKPDLGEARRLLDAGMRLVVLNRYEKRPGGGEGWNRPENFAQHIDERATGYGLPLEVNRLCSIDPDNWALAVKGMVALGFELETLMNAGVRTRSTRPGSGGRSAFAADGEIGWLKFKSKATGTVLELRAHSPNLQDCVPGLVYRTKAGQVCTQTYANSKRLDNAPPLPDELWRWWERCSNDLDFLHDQERRFFAALGERAAPSLSASRPASGRLKLAYPSQWRTSYNGRHGVPGILARHGYQYHERENRWSPPSATGAPGVREVPGKDGLWASDHASDPLTGVFDAWTACVVLDHDGNLKAAEAAYEVERAGEQFEQLPSPPAEEGHGKAPGAQPEATPARGRAEHPLLRFVDLSQAPPAPRWVIPGFVAQGVVMIAGGWGVGKTTALLPLSMTTAGLHQPDAPLAPKHWRHVVYVTEDVEQALRIIEGIVKHGGIGLDANRVQERLHLVSAQRMHVDYVAEVAACYRERFTRLVDDVPVLPLVVFDTRSACFEMDEENSNSEASAIMAVLRQRFEGLPVWIVGHLAKAAMNRTDVLSLSSRGGGAWDADAAQTMFLIREEEQRFLVIGKPRFEPRWRELEIESWTHSVEMRDEFGKPEIVTLRWGIPTPLTQSREQAKVNAQLEVKKRAEAELRASILDAAQTAWQIGYPLNRSGLKARIGGNSARVSRAIENLISEGWLHEVEVPRAIKLNNRKTFFLVALSAHEYDEWRDGKAIPEEKQRVPASWRKPEDSVSSETERTEDAAEDTNEPQGHDSDRSKSVRSPKGKNGRNERRGLECPPPVPSVPQQLETPRTDGNGREQTERRIVKRSRAATLPASVKQCGSPLLPP